MAIPAFWIEQHSFEVGAYPVQCSACGGPRQTVTAEYSCVVYAFLFGFVKRLELVVTCDSCGRSARIAGEEVPARVRKRIPFLHRFGCLAISIAGVLLAATFFVVNNR